MAKDPAFLFYTADFLTGVVFMTDEEVGKYIRILCLLHQHNGKLERCKIEKVVGKLSESIMEKLDLDGNGCLFNKRLLLETKKRQDYCESRRRNIQERYKKPTYVEHMNKHMDKHMENENENKDININRNKEFDVLWSKYPNKVGKKAALKHYEASVKTEEDIALINKALESYLKSERVAKGFIQNASTWFLNWKDWTEYTEELCQKCKGSGIWTSTTGYENICSCAAGLRKRGKL